MPAPLIIPNQGLPPLTHSQESRPDFMTVTARWYHCSVIPVSRSADRSAVAAAAYRIGKKLHDDRTQITHNYTKRQGVEASFIVAPAHAPAWVSDPQQLWNQAERAEKRCNSQTAREIVLALPSAISPEERQQLAHGFASHLVERYGVAAMVALHEPSKGGDDRNHHAHILLTTRRMEPDGLGNKTRELDDLKTGKLEVRHIRETAADLINATLEKAGSDERVDHRSHKDRGLEQLPTERLSLEEIAQEKKGKRSKAGDRNREIKETNETITALTEQRDELDRQILEASQEAEAEQPREPTEEPSQTPVPASPKPDPNDALVENFIKQIKEHGEIKSHRLGRSLIGYAIEQATDWVHEASDYVKGKWHDLTHRSRGGDLTR